MPVHRSLTPLGTSYGSGVAWAVRSSMEYLDAAASIDAGSRPPRALASSSSYAVALPTWSGTAAGSSAGTSAGRGDAGSSGGAGDVDGSSSVASFVVVVRVRRRGWVVGPRGARLRPGGFPAKGVSARARVCAWAGT